jgi:hypothetical protein
VIFSVPVRCLTGIRWLFIRCEASDHVARHSHVSATLCALRHAESGEAAPCQNSAIDIPALMAMTGPFALVETSLSTAAENCISTLRNVSPPPK